MDLESKRILVVYDHRDAYEKMRLSIKHHLQALEEGEVNHDIYYHNSYVETPDWLPREAFDVVILHTTLLCWRWTGDQYFIPFKKQLDWIGDLDCLKIALPQDEYDHAEILDEWLLDWGVSVIFTNFDERHRQILHPLMYDRADFYRCFTGYIDETEAERLRSRILPSGQRQLDMVYRARNLPYWFGHIGQMKREIAAAVQPRMQAAGFQADISTRPEDTVLGDGWFDFLASAKTVLGCEGGSSVIDYRGEVQTRIRALLAENPNLTFQEASTHMPSGWDDYDFYAISPRHFEAILTRTCQVLIEGNYEGVLEADRHYIPLKADYSNFDEVAEKIRDAQTVNQITERAYQEVYLSGLHTYRAFAGKINRAIQEHSTPEARVNRLRQKSEAATSLQTLRSLEKQLVAERNRNVLLESRLIAGREGSNPAMQNVNIFETLSLDDLNRLAKKGLKWILGEKRLILLIIAMLLFILILNAVTTALMVVMFVSLIG